MSLRDELQGVYDQHGQITARLVLDAAKDAPDGALHAHVFHVDDDEAAERYYLSRCSDLIRKVKIRFKSADGQSKSVRRYQTSRDTEGRNVYKDTDEIVENPLAAQMLLRQMEYEWGALKARYTNFQEFWDLVRNDSEAA